MSSEIATTIAKQERRRWRTARRDLRILAVQVIGPLTMLAGVVWAIAQPYRVAFLHPDGKGIYDYLFQPPLLVVVVGLLYAVLIAPALVADLGEDDRGSAT